jgi:hypothetical protein
MRAMLSAVLGLLLLFATTPAAALTEPAGRVQELGAGEGSRATAITSNGDVLVERDGQAPVRITRRGVMPLPLESAAALTTTGVVVGRQEGKPGILSGTRFTPLGTYEIIWDPTGTYRSPFEVRTVEGINARRAVIGIGLDQWMTRVTAYYLPPGGTPTVLPGPAYAAVGDINNRGQVAYTGYSRMGVGVALRFDPRGGRRMEIPPLTPGPHPWSTSMVAEGISGRGAVVGVEIRDFSAEQVARAWRWDGRAIHGLEPLPGHGHSGATAVNDRGDVVGWSDVVPRADLIPGPGTRAVLWRADGTVVDLGPGLARDVNQRGDVVGERGGRAVRWQVRAG